MSSDIDGKRRFTKTHGKGECDVVAVTVRGCEKKTEKIPISCIIKVASIQDVFSRELEIGLEVKNIMTRMFFFLGQTGMVIL